MKFAEGGGGLRQISSGSPGQNSRMLRLSTLKMFGERQNRFSIHLCLSTFPLRFYIKKSVVARCSDSCGRDSECFRPKLVS